MRWGLTTSAVVATTLVLACAAPPIESDLDNEEVPLPERTDPPPQQNGGPGTDDQGSSSGGPVSSAFTLKVTIAGAGAGTFMSAPTGLTCAGTTCTGTFPKGTAVALTPAPAS